MNQDIERKILRQLKLLNGFIVTFGILFLVGIAVAGFFLFQAVIFVRDAGDKITTIQQTTTEKLDVKSQICNGTDNFSTFIKNSTSACQ